MDLANPMQGLQIQQTQLELKEQKVRERERGEYSAPAPAGEPLTAPMPVTAKQPSVGVWNPEIGIKFGGGGVPVSGAGAQNQRQVKGGQWEAGKGVKFS